MTSESKTDPLQVLVVNSEYRRGYREGVAASKSENLKEEEAAYELGKKEAYSRKERHIIGFVLGELANMLNGDPITVTENKWVYVKKGKLIVTEELRDENDSFKESKEFEINF